MAGVSIETGPVDYRDQLSRTPKEKWASVFSERRLYIGAEFQHGCRCVIDWLAEAEEFHFELGYESADEMLQEELNIPPDWVRMAATVLEATGENLSKAEVDRAIELKSHGGDRRSEQARQDQPISGSLKYGGNPDYLKARLQRDHPEIAEALEQGEYRSARAAAIEAGIIKPVPTIRLVNDINKVARAISRHLNDEQRIALAEALLPAIEQ